MGKVPYRREKKRDRTAKRGVLSLVFIWCWKSSAHDHAGLAFVPNAFKGGGVLPILVDLTAVVVVVGVGDIIPLLRVIAADQDGMVVADQPLGLAFNDVIAIEGRGPPEGQISYNAVPRQQLSLEL